MVEMGIESSKKGWVLCPHENKKKGEEEGNNDRGKKH